MNLQYFEYVREYFVRFVKGVALSVTACATSATGLICDPGGLLADCLDKARSDMRKTGRNVFKRISVSQALRFVSVLHERENPC